LRTIETMDAPARPAGAAPRAASARLRPRNLDPLAQAVEDLVQAFARDPELAFRTRAPASFDDARAHERLRELLRHPDELVRWAAVRVLALAPTSAATRDLLARAAEDVEPLVWKEAAVALERRVP
jgi:HEAT repeat protein